MSIYIKFVRLREFVEFKKTVRDVLAGRVTTHKIILLDRQECIMNILTNTFYFDDVTLSWKKIRTPSMSMSIDIYRLQSQSRAHLMPPNRLTDRAAVHPTETPLQLDHRYIYPVLNDLQHGTYQWTEESPAQSNHGYTTSHIGEGWGRHAAAFH